MNSPDITQFGRQVISTEAEIMATMAKTLDEQFVLSIARRNTVGVRNR